MLSSLRLVLRVDVLPGDQYNVAHATDGLWTLLDHLGPDAPADAAARRQVLGHRAGDGAGGAEGLAVSVPPAHDGECADDLWNGRCGNADWSDAGQGWQGKETTPAAVWLEPATADHPVAPQTGP